MTLECACDLRTVQTSLGQLESENKKKCLNPKLGLVLTSATMLT